MSIQEQIEALEGLAALDARLSDVSALLDGERGQLSVKRQELGELEERLAATQQSVDDMERLRGELSQEVRLMSVQVDKSREKLSRCRTEREANAAQREVEELRKLYRDRELEIEKLAGLIEQARTETSSLDSRRGEISGELGSSEGEVTTRLADLDGQRKELVGQRAQLQARIPAQLMRRYELIRNRKGLPAIAHTTNGTCSACHMQMPPQQFQLLLRDDKLDSCPNCNRIIYFRPPDGASEDAAADEQ